MHRIANTCHNVEAILVLDITHAAGRVCTRNNYLKKKSPALARLFKF